MKNDSTSAPSTPPSPLKSAGQGVVWQTSAVPSLSKSAQVVKGPAQVELLIRAQFTLLSTRQLLPKQQAPVGCGQVKPVQVVFAPPQVPLWLAH